MSERTRHAVAVCAYLGVTLWIARAVLPAMADSYPLGVGVTQGPVGDGDVIHMVWATSRNARTLVTHPTRIRDFEICHPLPGAVALGHHMYAEGLLALVPYAFTGEPIGAFNAVAIAMPWIAAVAMYALAYYWTRSAVAAFVSGALFAFEMPRIWLLRWPSIVGDVWMPLALLFAYRLCVTGRWRDAAALAALLAMQLLESFYQALPAAVLGGVYGATLLVTFRARLRVLAPKLMAVGAAVAVVGAFVATPYLHARSTWSTMAGHASILPPLNAFAPGTLRWPGTCLVALGLLGLADRIRRRRHAHDPRLPLALGGLLVVSLVVRGVELPGGGWLPAPGPWLIAVVPGLDLGRVMSIGILGTWLVLAFLAAFGVAAVLEHRGPRARTILGAAIIGIVLGETLVPALATRSFGTSTSMTAARIDVPRGFIARYRDAFPDGAVLDVPADDPPLAFGRRAHYVLVAAFHRRPTITCFTSFASPLLHDLVELGTRLPDPRAAEALYALGVRSLLLHTEEYTRPEQVQRISDALGRLSDGNPRLVPLGEADGHRLYRLESSTPVHRGLEPLVAGAALGIRGIEHVALGADAVGIGYRNGDAAATFRHPDPLEPSRLVVRWYDANGAPVLEHEASAMLPLALAPGETTSRTIATPVPPILGVYRVTAAAAVAPERVLGTARVSVEPAHASVRAPDERDAPTTAAGVSIGHAAPGTPLGVPGGASNGQ